MAGSGVALAISKIAGLHFAARNAVAHRKSLMPKLPKTRKASIMAALAVEESSAEIVTWRNSG
jgi:NO-binding membrane sensor protein with MHYT domain